MKMNRLIEDLFRATKANNLKHFDRLAGFDTETRPSGRALLTIA
jgi:hypothetical protein